VKRYASPSGCHQCRGLGDSGDLGDFTREAETDFASDRTLNNRRARGGADASVLPTKSPESPKSPWASVMPYFSNRRASFGPSMAAILYNASLNSFDDENRRSGMANLGRMLRQLRGERSRAQKELDRLDDAIAVFEKLVAPNPGREARVRSAGNRKVSAATRRKMSKAQKARWAKLRQQGAGKG